MRTKLLGLFAILSLVAGVLIGSSTGYRHSLVAWAQSNPTEAWAPLSAKRTVRTYEITPGGKALVAERTGQYFRNRAGSVYQRDLSVLGPVFYDNMAFLEDAQTGEAYRIDYKSKTAKSMGKANITLPRQPADLYQTLKSSSPFLGKEVVSGVQCEIFKLRSSGTGEIRGEGEMWLAPSLSYAVVKSVFRNHFESGANDQEVVTTLEDIHAGVDPDPALFQVPEGFEIAGLPPAPCCK